MRIGGKDNRLGSGERGSERLGGVSWIFGSSRSGSTWLLRMLREIDGVAGIDDPHLGHHLGPWRPISLAWAVAEETPELRRLDELKAQKDSYFFNERYRHVWQPALRDLVEARFLAEAGEQVGARRRALFVKEPGSQAADLMLSLFERSQLVFLLRDGRDVVDSWVDAYRSGTWAIEEGAFPASRMRREALVRWQASVWSYRTRAVAAAFDAQDPGRRLLVRYEHLLDDPVRELGRICGVAELAVGPGELEEIAARHSFEELPSGDSGRGHEQRSASPGAWRENLTRAEQRAMHEIMEPELRRFGYLRAPRLQAA